MLDREYNKAISSLERLEAKQRGSEHVTDQEQAAPTEQARPVRTLADLAHSAQPKWFRIRA